MTCVFHRGTRLETLTGDRTGQYSIRRSMAHLFLLAVTADTDLRLSRFLDTSEGYWLSLQVAYDLEEAHRAGHYEGIPRHAA